MFEKNCPHCSKPISAFSKGMLKGKFACPSCGQALVSRPNVAVMAGAAGAGGALGVLFGLSLTLAVPIAVALAFPFAITPAKGA